MTTGSSIFLFLEKTSHQQISVAHVVNKVEEKTGKKPRTNMIGQQLLSPSGVYSSIGNYGCKKERYWTRLSIPAEARYQLVFMVQIVLIIVLIVLIIVLILVLIVSIALILVLILKH